MSWGGATVFAQSGYEVKGVVVDAVGPVIGATIIEQGTSNGTSTSLDGDYILTVSSADAVVEISCIGYASQTFTASQVPPTVTLTEDTQFLDEVVVIGYGTVKKEDMTGSITAIKADEINRGALVNTQDMLKGKVPGLHIIPGDGGPGSGSTIRIRGAASLNASNDPLIVIDGVPIANGGGSGMSNPLDMINPSDIESFTVFKDASSAAIYGSRASNGVIVITTKKGKGSKPQVSYNGSMSIQHNSAPLQVLSAEEYREFVTSTFDPASAQGKLIAARLGEGSYDYQDMVFRTAFSHDRNLSVHGNVKDRMPYRASLGWTGQTGTLKGSSYDRGTLDLSLSPNFFDKHLTIDLNAKGVYTYSDYTDGGVVGKAAFMNPTQDPYFRNPDGSINYDICNGFYNEGSWDPQTKSFQLQNLVGEGPLSLLYDKMSHGKALRFLGSAAFDYKVHGFEALRFNLNLSLDWSAYNGYSGVRPGSAQAWADTENRGIGQYSEDYQLRRTQTLEAYANFNETWGIHNLDVVAGYSWQNAYGANHSLTYFNRTHELKLGTIMREEIDGNGEVKEYPVLDDNGNVMKHTPESRYPWYMWESFLVSFYGRINYSIDSRYLFTASIRADGSSRFSKKNRWGIFPAGAFAWNIKNEGFLKDVKAVTQLKFRLSAGMTGQQDGISEYASLAKYNITNNYYGRYDMGEGYDFQHQLSPLSYDPEIKWETTTTYNAAIDFGFWNDRITGSVDAYLRNTNDLLNNVITPMGSNFGNTVLTNIGSMQNKGIEFAVNVIPLQTEDWHMSVGFNGTFQDTKFTKLNNTDDPGYYVQTSGISHGTGSFVGRHSVGGAPYTFWVLKQLYDHTGKPIQNAFVDLNDDGMITDADKYAAGDPTPDFYYGINFKLSYRNWDFGFNGHGNAGYKVFNDFASNNSTAYFSTNTGAISNFATVVKRTGFTEISTDEQYMSDMFIEDASFFRMDDINLGYTFREVGQWGGNIRIAACCQNVFVISKYSGIDPEINSTDGVDKTFWPRPRTYSVRLNINF